MPAYTRPFGFQPVNTLAGAYTTHSQRMVPIQSGYGVALRPGDLVRISGTGGTTGFLVKDLTGTAAVTNGGGILGVFMGCNYTDPVLGFTNRQVWTAGTVAPDAVGVVIDDPEAVFRAAFVSGTTVVTGLTRANALGRNVSVIQNVVAVNQSDIAVSAAATTNTLPFKIVDVDPDSWNGTLFTAMFVTYNGTHAYRTAAGPTA